jgi:hypothetical protein
LNIYVCNIPFSLKHFNIFCFILSGNYREYSVAQKQSELGGPSHEVLQHISM